MSRVRGERRVEPVESGIPPDATHERLWGHVDERKRDWERRRIWGEVRMLWREGKIALVEFYETQS